jgi:hypothetical protein
MFYIAGYVCTGNAEEKSVPLFQAKELFAIQSDFSQPSDVVVGNSDMIYVLDGVNGLFMSHQRLWLKLEPVKG